MRSGRAADYATIGDLKVADKTDCGQRQPIHETLILAQSTPHMHHEKLAAAAG